MNADDNEQSGPGWKDKFDRFSTWRADLTEEVILLPQALAELRETIGDLRRVSSRLEGATEGIEVLLRRAESSGLAPLARQLDAAASDVESQMSEIQQQVPGGKLVGQAVDELQKTIDTFTSLIPRSKPKPES